jgi:hypothetical protein
MQLWIMVGFKAAVHLQPDELRELLTPEYADGIRRNNKMNNMNVGPEFTKPSHGAVSGNSVEVEQMSLNDLLQLAAHFHMGLTTNSTAKTGMKTLMQLIKQRAAVELDVGDGMKCETVRVERKLDGTVSIMFGI